MKKRKVRAKSLFAPVLQSVLISIVTYVLLLVLLLLGITPEQHDIRVGLPAGMDIMATASWPPPPWSPATRAPTAPCPTRS